MEDIVLIGGGGHCKSVIDVIEEQGKFRIAGIVDRLECVGNKVFDYDVIGTDEELSDLSIEIKHAIISVGQIRSADLRIKLFMKAKNAGFNLPVIVSPRAHVSKHSVIAEGTIVAHDVLINSNVKIGKNCIINTKALIEHDSEIDDNCHISTGTIINGNVKVGCNCFIGSGVITKEGVVIVKNSFVKAGSLVK